MLIDSNDDSVDFHPETMGDCPMCDLTHRLINLATKGEFANSRQTPQELIDTIIDKLLDL